MKLNQQTIPMVSVMLLASMLVPTPLFAHPVRDKQVALAADFPSGENRVSINESLRSRIEAQKEEAEALRDRADALREQVLHPEKEQAQPPQLEIKPIETLPETRLDTSALQEQVQQFKEAKEALQQVSVRLKQKREALNRAISSFKEHAEVLRKRTERFPVIEEQLKTSIEAEIAADVATLEEFRLKAQQTQSAQEFKALTEALQEHRTEQNRQKVRKLMLLAHVSVFEHQALQTASQRAQTIQTMLDEFEQSRKDIAVLEELLLEARTNLDEVSAELKQLRQDILEGDVTDAMMQDARQTLRDARQSIKDAYQIFRTIARQTTEL